MALVKQFDRELNNLWSRRIARLQSLIRTRRGRLKSFTRKVKDTGIARVERIAIDILSRQGARAELSTITKYQRRHHVRGRGIRKRFATLIAWAEALTGPVVYSFWKGRQCLYVGKGKSWTRLKGYEKSVYLRDATTVRVRGVTSPSHLAKAECLMRHLFDPRGSLPE